MDAGTADTLDAIGRLVSMGTTAGLTIYGDVTGKGSQPGYLLPTQGAAAGVPSATTVPSAFGSGLLANPILILAGVAIVVVLVMK